MGDGEDEKKEENQEEKNEENKEEKKPFNKILLYILIGLMVLTGSVNSIFNKILQKQSGKHTLFEQHHWIITFGMFLGELVSIFFYAYIVYKRRKQAAQGNDDTLFSTVDGIVKFERLGKDKKQASCYPVGE